MYSISKNDEYLLVKFIDDFDYPMIKTAIRHETMMREYSDTNDIWLIGEKRAEICRGEIDLMIREFQGRCALATSRTKTAIVVNAGLTGSIIELFVHSLRQCVAFEIEIFRTLDEAKEWLGVSEVRVA